jgi:hypothetical protein
MVVNVTSTGIDDHGSFTHNPGCGHPARPVTTKYHHETRIRDTQLGYNFLDHGVRYRYMAVQSGLKWHR